MLLGATENPIEMNIFMTPVARRDRDIFWDEHTIHRALCSIGARTMLTGVEQQAGRKVQRGTQLSAIALYGNVGFKYMWSS